MDTRCKSTKTLKRRFERLKWIPHSMRFRIASFIDKIYELLYAVLLKADS